MLQSPSAGVGCDELWAKGPREVSRFADEVIE
jgi:hypothetical protein